MKLKEPLSIKIPSDLYYAALDGNWPGYVKDGKFKAKDYYAMIDFLIYSKQMSTKVPIEQVIMPEAIAQ